jgi:formate dehydrogenase maturation protein FdhE
MRDDIAPSSSSELHICPACTSPLITLVNVVGTGSGQWHLRLRCPECESFHEVVCTEPGLARLEQELCRGMAALQRELDRLVRVQFEEDAERFIDALYADAILPFDFGAAR